MTSDQGVLFKSLNDTEKLSKFSQLARLVQADIVVWEKGKKEKVTLVVDTFSRVRIELKINGKYPPEFIGKVLLLTFEINGLRFFGKCKLQTRAGKITVLNCNYEIFKSERRLNFRLLTYPHHEVYMGINIGIEGVEQSNVLGLNIGMSQTSLFKNFLNIIGDKEEQVDPEGFLRFRIMDISVTGLALQFGAIEAELFKDSDQIYKNSFIDFNGELISIPKSKILYMNETKAVDKKTKIVKAGIQFLEVDTNLDEALAHIINQTLRNVESEFEDFIK
jgi:hypothetical protein